MKRLISVLLILCLFAGLAACSAKKAKISEKLLNYWKVDANGKVIMSSSKYKYNFGDLSKYINTQIIYVFPFLLSLIFVVFNLIYHRKVKK